VSDAPRLVSVRDRRLMPILSLRSSSYPFFAQSSRIFGGVLSEWLWAKRCGTRSSIPLFTFNDAPALVTSSNQAAAMVPTSAQ
jgi:hypothetical protein